MMMLIKMAWLNIWRNKRRATILLCAMTTGLFGVLVSMGVTNGWISQMVEGAVQTYEGHVKIMGAGYNDNPIIENSLEVTPAITEALTQNPEVNAWSERIVVQGLLSTAEHSLVVRMAGIDPEQEQHVSVISKAMVEGSFLDQQQVLPILIGKRLLDKINGRVGSKVVLMSQRLDGEVGSSAFRITGVFDTGNAAFDESMVYVPMNDARSMLGLSNRVTEVAVVLNDIDASKAVAAQLTDKIGNPDIEILSWQQRLPLVVEMIRLSTNVMIPYYAIFYIAMAFGIVNMLLMSIGERKYEIGVMLAVGMSRSRLVLTILIESLFLGVVAIIFGTALGWGVVGWFTVHGIDLSALAEGMAQFGLGRYLRPYLNVEGVVLAGVATLFVSILSAFSPARRAARMVPVEAIRSVG